MNKSFIIKNNKKLLMDINKLKQNRIMRDGVFCPCFMIKIYKDSVLLNVYETDGYYYYDTIDNYIYKSKDNLIKKYWCIDEENACR